jgi:hypothetical protein
VGVRAAHADPRRTGTLGGCSADAVSEGRETCCSSGFLSVGFLSVGFLSVGFLSVGFLSVGFLSVIFLSVIFLSVIFLLVIFLKEKRDDPNEDCVAGAGGPGRSGGLPGLHHLEHGRR